MSTLKGKRSHKILSFIFNSERQAKAGIGGCGGGGWGGGGGTKGSISHIQGERTKTCVTPSEIAIGSFSASVLRMKHSYGCVFPS